MTKGVDRRFPSPLRYPGGKGKLANFFKMIFLENEYDGYEYVEPFAGGASVALSLLYEGYASRIHINDLNRSIFAFWTAVLNQTDDLCRLIHDTPVTIDEWHRQSAIQADPDSTGLELAFSTFFLNRTNRSGIIRGGVIGGKEQEGDWTLDARYNKQGLIRRIEKIARYRDRIRVTNLDAVGHLRELARPRTLLYIDPPYYGQGHRLYQDWFTEEDHAALALEIRQIDSPWVVSYDPAPEVYQLYNGYASLRYSLSYSAAEHYTGSEVLFFSPGLRPPAGRLPSKIRAADVDRERRRRSAAAKRAPEGHI